jgi:peptidoglycan/xylan/chitin deacetylase (PgdA/CDA1 family)
MKEQLKRALGLGLFKTRLDSLLLRDIAVVVAFHRVQRAAAAEGLTVAVRTFERHCRFFRDHFNVVPLGDVVGKLEQGLPLNRELAITFDDGYLDNFEHAAPILERLSLPATFFVVTQWIGTDVVPWWDRLAGVPHPWMTWAQVRLLRARGFDIGAHTRTHVDLGLVDRDEARGEVAGARVDLERELNAPVQLFAFPYGRRENITNASNAIVKGAGFRCCCSCFGGVVTPDTDPFRLPRVPINESCPSPQVFGLQVALGRTLQPA